MTRQISDDVLVMVLAAVRAGASIDDACEPFGFSGRTLQRRAATRPALRAGIDDAIATRDAARPLLGHGTAACYARGCRRDECRAANAARCMQSKRARVGKPIPDHVEHGTDNAYNYYGCRCDVCVPAQSARCGARAARRKALAA